MRRVSMVILSIMVMMTSAVMLAQSSSGRGAAIRKCNDDFRAAMKTAAAKTTAYERAAAEDAARKQHAACVAAVPR